MQTMLALLTIHFVADFLLQNGWMANNKSKNWWALGAHVAAYSAPFTILLGLQFGVITFVTHFITDAITSRLTRRTFPLLPDAHMPHVYLDNEGVDGRSRWRFFAIIGFDQLIHAYTLAWTLEYVHGFPPSIVLFLTHCV